MRSSSLSTDAARVRLMTARRLVLVVVAGMLVASCAQAFGHRIGSEASLVDELGVAQRVLTAELDRVFGEYTVVAEGVDVFRCDPMDMYKGAYFMRIKVDGGDQATSYELFIENRRGLSEVNVMGRAAGFDIDGISGQMSVFDEPDVDGLRVAANTGCYDEDKVGVDDPYSLQWGEW
jgi:hypothetical protein